jgi:hypothetical protein
MKCPLRKTILVEWVLSVMLEGTDGRLRRRYSQLAQDGAEQARRLLADLHYAQARRRSGLTARRLGMLGVLP